MIKLSRRETEILGLIAEGYGYKQIAFLLAISSGTVRYHMKGIFKKLGIPTRKDVATAWYKQYIKEESHAA